MILRSYLLKSLLLSGLIGCTTVGVNQEQLTLAEIKNAVTKRDMVLTINGAEYIGVASVPAAKKYDIKAKWFIPAEVVTISNCHVDEQFQKTRIKDKLEIEFVYEPASGLEDRDSCIMEIAALDRDGQHSFATIDMNHGEDLPFRSICGGSSYSAIGSAICQSRAGLIQQVNFDEPTFIEAVSDCPDPVDINGDKKVYEYTLALGACSYQAIGIPSGKWARLTTVGYNHFMIRSDPPVKYDQEKSAVVRKPEDILRGNR